MSDYSFCEVCRINHNLGRRHKYSSNHKKALKNILGRFSSKIKICCSELSDPVILDGEYEPGTSFWCHFCNSKVIKHVTDRELTIKYGGVYEHLSSDAHIDKVELFWKNYCVEEKFKSTFTIPAEKFSRYRTLVEEKLHGHVVEKAKERTMAVETLRLQERKRAQVLAESSNTPELREHQQYKTVRNSKGILQNPTGWHDNERVWGGGIVKYPKGSNQWIPWEMDLYSRKKKGMPTCTSTTSDDRYTVRAEGHGLTSISVPSARMKGGNIHTGATPPWLIVDRDATTTAPECNDPIGPSEEMFRAYVEKRKKRKDLKSKKVGSNFDHSQSTSADWLPSFGRIWNSGPRWQSRRQFRKEMKPS